MFGWKLQLTPAKAGFLSPQVPPSQRKLGSAFLVTAMAPHLKLPVVQSWPKVL